MSYCNDIALAVKQNDYMDFFRKLLENPESEPVMDTIKDARRIYKTIDYLRGIEPIAVVILHWNYYKGWNQFNVGVKEIRKWYKKLDDYEFVRCGEDIGDIEQEHHHKNDNEAWYIVDTCQSIVIDGKEE